MLIQNHRGNYSFLKGIAPYSAGVVAMAGFEILHVRLLPAPPLAQGFALLERHLGAQKRPMQALCGMELRSPKPFTFEGFAEFNAGYVAVLKRWDVLLDGVNPVARTNVCPATDPPHEPALHAFSYTVPSGATGPWFVIAGAGELPEGTLGPRDIVRAGEVSADAIREKARFVLGLMDARLRGLGADWRHVTATDVYTIHDIHPLLVPEILPRAGAAAHQGFTWHYTRPPIIGIEYEMDLRACRRELVMGTGR
jgi:hypothetical protein